MGVPFEPRVFIIYGGNVRADIAKNMVTDKGNIIKKLFEGSLTLEERKELNASGLLEATFRDQWEEVSDECRDTLKEERILSGIRKKIKKTKEARFYSSIYRYGMVVMIVVCLVLSSLLWLRVPEREVVYVMNTGYQSMDSVRLSDGTKVMLGAGSRLVYPERFAGTKREVTLSGQAFFDVTPDRKHLFVVKTTGMDVTVLGTSFEIFSYEGDEEAETILLTGKVNVTIPGNERQAKETYTLVPNEKLAYHKGEGVKITHIDADNYSAWRRGRRMAFKNEPLEMILPRLEKWYGQRIDCNPQVAGHYRFTFTVHSESLELILNYISHSTPLVYSMVGNDHYLIEEKK